METGKDPGAEDPAELAAKLLKEKGQLPEPIQKLLDKIKGKKDDEPEEGDPEVKEI